jgi:hypothetical protein
MPLLLHHHGQIVESRITALDAGEDEALKALLECVLLSPLKHLDFKLPACLRNADQDVRSSPEVGGPKGI